VHGSIIRSLAVSNSTFTLLAQACKVPTVVQYRAPLQQLIRRLRPSEYDRPKYRLGRSI
jgi:hypothetical protein